MKKYMVIIFGCLALLSSAALSQEVIIPDFPLGVAGSVNKDLFKPYNAELRAIADTLRAYPLARAIITGGADGERYRQNNDAKNAGLALGRAHTLRRLLINEFGVDSTRIFIQSEEVKTEGPRHRYASIRIDRELADLNSRLQAVENRPPLEKHFTEVRETPVELKENLGLQFSLGLTSSPFGGIPIAASAFTWKRVVYVEAVVGHTFWNSSFQFEGADLDTKRRLVGGYLIYFPFEKTPVGLVGGWVRIEEISQEYYEYVKLSDGPVLGLRVSPVEHLSITGAYNPSKRRIAGSQRSESKNDQFMVSLTAFIAFGGER